MNQEVVVADRPRIQELDKFGIYVSAPGEEGKRSRLAWSILNGNPRISVYTNITSDANVNYGIISAPMNPETFYIFMHMLESMCKGENGKNAKIDCNSKKRLENGKYGDMFLLSELYFGKDDNGIMWISVQSTGRPKIKFEIHLSDFHKIYKSDGTAISAGEGSVLQTLAMINALRAAYYSFAPMIKQPGQNARPMNTKTAPVATNTMFENDIPF
jgi:hypothetical protein